MEMDKEEDDDDDEGGDVVGEADDDIDDSEVMMIREYREEIYAYCKENEVIIFFIFC